MEEFTLHQNQIQNFSSDPNVYAKIYVLPEGLLIPDELNIINKHVKEEGKIEISLGNLKPEQLKKQTMNLKFAGFVNIKQEGQKLTADKKCWKKVDITNTTKEVSKTASIVSEDELIDPYDSYQRFAKENDCMTKPKPCKNCNCGRAEENNKNEESKDIDPNASSACGKCYLGDAYRCAGCPYRGTPAFRPGDKVEFNKTQLNDAIQLQEKETINTKVSGTKVKIDLDS